MSACWVLEGSMEEEEPNNEENAYRMVDLEEMR